MRPWISKRLEDVVNGLVLSSMLIVVVFPAVKEFALELRI